MDEVQRQRALVVIGKIQCAIDRGVQHFDKAGRQLNTVSTVIDAWAHGGVTIREEMHRASQGDRQGSRAHARRRARRLRVPGPQFRPPGRAERGREKGRDLGKDRDFDMER